MMVIPFVTMIVFMVMIITGFSFEPEGPKNIIWIFDYMPILFLLCAGTQLLWVWNVGENLRKYIHSSDRKPRINLFRITFFVPLIYMCFFPFFMKGFVFGMTDPAQIIPIMLLMMLGNFVMMFCFLNNNYVVAKTIKMAELQRKVTFNDFVGDFFFMLVFPIAIWFLQPRINKIVNGEAGEKNVRITPPEKDLLDM